MNFLHNTGFRAVKVKLILKDWYVLCFKDVVFACRDE